MTVVNITIDYTKCNWKDGVNPKDCALCMNLCGPPPVFKLAREYEPDNSSEENFVGYKLVAMAPEFCVVCNRCMEKCPSGAIKIAVKSIDRQAYANALARAELDKRR